MLKQQTSIKLPTWLQWLKEQDEITEPVTFLLDAIFWGDAYKTITFQTELFRYSIKFGGANEYREATDEVMDALPYKELTHAFLKYYPETKEMEVFLGEEAKEEGWELLDWKQFDWGIRFEFPKPGQEKAPSPAKQKKPAAKKQPPKQPTPSQEP